MADWETFQKYGMVLILVIVGFSIFAALYPEAASAGDGVNATNMCEATGCYYNASGTITGDVCYSNSNSNVTCAEGGHDPFPLNSLVAGGGVLFIVLAASILVLYIRKSR